MLCSSAVALSGPREEMASEASVRYVDSVVAESNADGCPAPPSAITRVQERRWMPALSREFELQGPRAEVHLFSVLRMERLCSARARHRVPAACRPALEQSRGRRKVRELHML